MRGFLAGLLAFGMMAGSSVASAETIRVGTGDYPPFTDESAADGGSVNRIVSKIAAAAGVDVEFSYMPWMRALELTRSGRLDASSFWYHKADREADFIHVGPLFEDRLVFFHMAQTDVPAWKTLNDMAPFKIGATTGYTYTPEFWKGAEDGLLRVEAAPSDEANFRKLVAGRIDVFPMSQESGLALIARLFTAEQISRITFTEKPLSVTGGYLLVSRKVPGAQDIAARLQRALGTLETARQ